MMKIFGQSYGNVYGNKWNIKWKINMELLGQIIIEEGDYSLDYNYIYIIIHKYKMFQ